MQQLDSSVQPEVVVNQLHPDYPVTAEQAHQVSRALIAVADEAERCQA
jgi:hypothetical protein